MSLHDGSIPSPHLSSLSYGTGLSVLSSNVIHFPSSLQESSRLKILKALKWLQSNNEWFKNIKFGGGGFWFKPNLPKIARTVPHTRVIQHKTHPVLGTDVDVSRKIIEYLPAKDVLQVALSSKSLMECIDVETAVAVCLNTGGNTMFSLENLENLIRKGAIHPLSGIRIIMICTRRVCEYCHKNKTVRVRASLGVLMCWHCQRRTPTRDIIWSSGNECPRLWTRSLRKVYWNPQKRHFHANQYYMAHRTTLQTIMNHPRIPVYNNSVRYLDDAGNPVLTPPFLLNEGIHFRSHDRNEVFFSRPSVDSFGDFSGPIFTYEDLRPLVTYLESPQSLGIDYYLDNVLDHVPPMSSYLPFLRAFHLRYKSAKAKWDRRYREKVQTLAYCRYSNIDLAVENVAMIALEFHSANINRWQQRRTIYNRPSATWLSKVLRRMMLLYREIPYMYGKYYLTYDTGDRLLDSKLHRVLGAMFKKPLHITRRQAQQYADMIFDVTESYFIQFSARRALGIFVNFNSNRIRTSGYNRSYNRRYTIDPDRRWNAWTDRTAARRL